MENYIIYDMAIQYGKHNINNITNQLSIGCCYIGTWALFSGRGLVTDLIEMVMKVKIVLTTVSPCLTI